MYIYIIYIHYTCVSHQYDNKSPGTIIYLTRLVQPNRNSSKGDVGNNLK